MFPKRGNTVRTLADIDKKNPNIIAGTDWGKVPIPQNYGDLYAHYGDPADADFQDKFLISIPHTLAGGKQIHVVSHICMVPALHDVFAKCGGLIKDYGGCYNYRPVRGGSSLSLHSWGIAIDLNVEDNPLGSTHPKQPQILIDTFKAHGFFWGGDYRHRRDPMHFQRSAGF
jgi:hypothetical protein